MKLGERITEKRKEQGIVHAGDLSDSLQRRIGKKVEFDFYDDETDMDLAAVAAEIIDVDEKWVLVHVETKKKAFDKLVRISSIKGIKEV